MNKWIPVTERLPEESQKVLITEEDGDVLIASYIDYTSIGEPIEWWAFDFVVYPTAWMPLPEPYRKETKDGKVH